MPPDALFSWSAAALAAVAAALSLFLLVKTLLGGRLPGCGPGSACDSVTTSRWARWGRIPVALPAALLYLLIAALLVWPRTDAPLLDHRDGILAGLALLALASALWFILIQALILRRICAWCMIDHAAGIAAAAIILHALSPQLQSHPALPLTLALASLAILILGQLLIEPRTYELQQPKRAPDADAPTPTAPEPVPVPAPSSPPTSITPSDSPASSPAPVPSRLLALLEGRLKIMSAAFPLFGPDDAPHVVVDMLDYTCEHCRELHHWLTQARAHFNNRLAVLAIPLPMESACNPNIQFTNPKHVNACTYTRYALAIWHADRAKFHEYHEWLYDPPRPPHLEDARGHAEQLVGPQTFAAALANPAVETQIKNAIGIYQFLGRGQIPKLVMNRGVLVGQIPSLQRLIQILDEDFRPRPPAPPTPPQDEITTSFIGGFR